MTPEQQATLNAYILADPTLNAYQNTSDGNYDLSIKLTELAPGDYALKTYFEGLVRTTTSFKIGPATTELKDPIALGPVSSSSVKQ